MGAVESGRSKGGGGTDNSDSLLRALVATPAIAIVRELELGTVVGGQYRVERLIGRGGMGIVYLARDLRLGREVALKLGSASAPAAAVRAELEARALAKLSHPNVVTIYQVGECAGGSYIAMEYVAGGTAREWVRAQPRRWQSVVQLYLAAGDGLAAAHAAGLVHRDFKPDNVLVGDDGRPRVADFGLVHGALASHEPEGGGQGVTQTGVRLGTPAYMAPEQLACGRADASSDQFAFCASLWEALFGRRAFAGGTPTELADAIAEGPPRLPERRDVPAWVIAALRRGLAPERDARWPSLVALLAALRREPHRRRRRFAIGSVIALALAGTAATFALRPDAGASAAHACARAEDAPDVYVDGAAASGGTGTASCPVRTIGEALALPARGPRTVHVAPGRYDRDHGEKFPLVVRGAVSIVGAGVDATRVIGTGTVDRADAGGVFDHTLTAAFVIGDPRATVAIASLSIEAETSTPELGRFGVVCDRGNLTGFEGPPPAANTQLANLAIGPGFDDAVVVATATRPSPIGCNLSMTGSLVHGSTVGMWVLGCGTGDGVVPARAQLEGNTFRSLGAALVGGIGVNVWDCTRELTSDRDTFEGFDGGIAIVEHAPTHGHFAITRDRFLHLYRYGLSVARAAAIDRLDDNSFAWNHGTARTANERAVGLVLDGETEPAPGYPRILHARGNTFTANDVAIELRGRAIAVAGAAPIVDFGRPGDPGGNTFACNATEHGAAAPGFDLDLAAPSDGTGTLLLAGNTWDHAPPHVARARAVNGSDIAIPPGPAPALVTTGAHAADRTYCRDPGP
ncbi:MAG TPA: protein kinase [Kofleriaceae bacterium]|nr:protein kinase [Kofleriaceae bacterium]